MSDIILYLSQPYFLRQGLLLNLDFTNLARLLGQQVSGILPSLSPELRLWVHAATADLLFFFFNLSVED